MLAAWAEALSVGKVGVWVFKRGKKTGELEIPGGLSEPIRSLLVFGSWIVGCCTSRFEVWRSSTLEHYTTITPTALTGNICTMPTFLNKVFVGKRDGSVEMWNVNSGRLIYTFVPPNAFSGPVTALQSTPALAALAIARSDGSVVIQDVRLDKIILQLNPNPTRKTNITSISFRTDGLGAGEDGQRAGIMATAGLDNGDVTLWDLNNGGRINGVLRGAHSPPSNSGGVSGGINKVEFLPGQAVVVTSGLDNALKSWIFDAKSLTTVPRILHCRNGHSAPVTTLGFMPTNSDGSDAGGKWLLSAGRDQSLWGWSLRRDGQSTELSQGHIRKKAKKLGALGNALQDGQSMTLEDLKAPEITCFSSSLNRDGGMGAAKGGGAVWTNAGTRKSSADATESLVTGWESIVTGHRGDKYARTWFWGRKKAGRWAFETGDSTEVTSVTVTSCGTFAIVGSAGGSITAFNLQSGMQRQKFPSPLTPLQAKKLKLIQANGQSSKKPVRDKFGMGVGKHRQPVTGLTVDPMNRYLYSCGLDGKLKFWKFHSGLLLHELDWSPMSAITASRYHKQSDLIALSCDDLSIRVIDTETKKLIRELWGCLGQISDFCFSHDGRWIIAASLDSIIRVWDLPTGHLINAIRLESPCTALAFSDTGEYLATAHADGVGVNIWNNRTLFTHVSTRLINDDEIIDAVAPTASGEDGQGLIEAAFDDDTSESIQPNDIVNLSDQLSTDMETLSLVPKSRWQTLLHLDAIRARNKPKEPPKPPEKAPFFLPSLEASKPAPAISQDNESQITPIERSRILKSDRISTESPFTVTLRTGTETRDYTPFIDHLKSLAPSAADIEIRSLKPNELVSFVTALRWRLQQRRDYELVQAWMAVFLKIHGESVCDDSMLVEALQAWRAEQAEEGRRLGELVGYCGGVLGFLRSTRV